MKTIKIYANENRWGKDDAAVREKRMEQIREESRQAQSHFLSSVPILMVLATAVLLLDAHNASQLSGVVVSLLLATLLFAGVFGLFLFLGYIFDVLDNEEMVIRGENQKPPVRMAS